MWKLTRINTGGSCIAVAALLTEAQTQVALASEFGLQPTAVPDLRANLVRLIGTGVRALEHDKRFEFAWQHIRSFDEARQLHAAGQLFENVREEEEEVPETVALLAEPEEQDVDDLEE